MAETPKQKLSRLLAERKRRRAKRKSLLARTMALEARIARLTAGIKRTRDKLRGGDVPGISNGWHPNAIRNQTQAGIGAFLNVPAKLVWHTTEGSSLPSYKGSHPHFTLDLKNRKLYQHIPVNSGAMALVSSAVAGVAGNAANAIQVELVGFSDASFARSVGKSAWAVENWTDADYAQIATLSRWIEKHCGVKRQCSVKFENRSHPLSASAWLNYAGHLGHQHVTGNLHWDPSGAFKIARVLA
jgi:hypothetical protein